MKYHYIASFVALLATSAIPVYAAPGGMGAGAHAHVGVNAATPAIPEKGEGERATPAMPGNDKAQDEVEQNRKTHVDADASSETDVNAKGHSKGKGKGHKHKDKGKHKDTH